MIKEQILNEVANYTLFYLFKCPSYPKGYIFHTLERVKEKDFFGDVNEYLVGKCVFTNERIWIDSRNYMKIKPKHKNLVKKWISNIF